MRSAVLVVLLLSCAAAAFLVSSVAGAEAPSSSEDRCFDLVLTDLVPCLDYAQQGSNVTKPSKDCCKGLASFLSKDPGCICTLLGDASNLTETVGVDISRVMNVPSLCKIDAKLDQCTGADGTAQGPSAAEGSSAAPSGSPGVSGGAAAPPPASEASTIWVSSGALVAALTATAAFAML